MHELSTAQIQFLKQRQHEKRQIHFCRAMLLFFFLALWEITAQLGIIDSFIFSSPSLIFKTFVTMLREQNLLAHIGITLMETLASFALVLIFGIGIAVLLWMSPKVSQILEPYLVVLNSLPKSALAPLLIVWLGANVRTIIVAGMSVALFGAILNLYTGFRETDEETCKLIATFGGGKTDCLKHVVFPSSIPLILSVMKVNIGLCLVGVIIGEFIGARSGLGYLIIYGSQTFKLNWVLMSIVILCVIAMVLYGILNTIEKHYLRKI
jgi:NitT/TauT family transport system permease protein